MTFRAIPLALAATLAAAPLLAQETQAEAPASLTTFAWPIPATVTVLESVTKKGKESKMRYRLEMTRREGGGIRVHYSNFEFVEFDGRDATTPAMKKALAAAAALAAAIPDLHVHADGTFEEATGIEEVMRKVVKFLAETRKWDEAQQKQVLAQMLSPQMVNVMKQAVGDYWACWVGAWHGWTVPAGKTEQVERNRKVLGVELPTTVISTHRGSPEAHPGKLHFERIVRSQGQKFTAAMLGFVGTLVQELGPQEQLAAKLPKLQFAVEEKLTVITDPKTLLPVVATSDKTTVVTDSEAKETKKQVERHRYEFDWSNGK